MGLEEIGLALAIIGTTSTVVTTISAGKQSRKQRQLERLRERRQAIQRIREARIKRAQIENLAANTGTQESSSAIGGAGSVSSQLSGAVSFLDTASSINDSIARLRGFESLVRGIGTLATAGSDISIVAAKNKAARS